MSGNWWDPFDVLISDEEVDEDMASSRSKKSADTKSVETAQSLERAKLSAQIRDELQAERAAACPTPSQLACAQTHLEELKTGVRLLSWVAARSAQTSAAILARAQKIRAIEIGAVVGAVAATAVGSLLALIMLVWFGLFVGILAACLETYLRLNPPKFYKARADASKEQVGSCEALRTRIQLAISRLPLSETRMQLDRAVWDLSETKCCLDRAVSPSPEELAAARRALEEELAVEVTVDELTRTRVAPLSSFTQEERDEAWEAMAADRADEARRRSP